MRSSSPEPTEATDCIEFPFRSGAGLLAAAFYAYARMRYGLGWAIALHGLNNGLPTLVFDVLITQPPDWRWDFRPCTRTPGRGGRWR